MSLFSAMADEGSVWSKSSSLFNISSPLNDLLQKESFTLEEILQEDELIQEVKTRNDKLLEYLCQPDIVMKLVEYIIEPSPNTKDDLRTLKYPYMACEVICCDILSITETLANGKDGKIAEKLFEFLYQDPEELDTRLAGYFEKVMSMLMVRKTNEVTALLNAQSTKLLKGFITHLGSFSIAELFKRLIQPYTNDYMEDCMDFGGLSVGYPPTNSWYPGEDDDLSLGTPTTSASRSLTWQTDTTVIDLLVDNLVAKDTAGNVVDQDLRKHSADVLVDIILCGSRSQSHDVISPTATTSSTSNTATAGLLDYLESASVVEKLIDLAIPKDLTEASNPNQEYSGSAITVLSALLSRHSNTRYNESNVGRPDTPIPPVVTSIIARLPQLCIALQTDYPESVMLNQRHQSIPRLGLRRLMLVGLVMLLTQVKYKEVDTALLKENLIPICLDMFFKFESVNMLHSDIESMVVGILDSGSYDLRVALIRNGKLLHRIVSAHEENAKVLKNPKGTSFAYMGHLHRICSMLLSLLEDIRGATSDEKGNSMSLNDMSSADRVLELLEEDKTAWNAWDTLAKDVLTPMYEQERMPLGGVAVSHANDDAFSPIDFMNPSDSLSRQFEDVIGGSSPFAPDLDDLDRDFDIENSHDTAMMADILNDSSDEEEDDMSNEIQMQSENDFISRHLDMDESSGENWANFEASFVDTAQIVNSPNSTPDVLSTDGLSSLMPSLDINDKKSSEGTNDIKKVDSITSDESLGAVVETTVADLESEVLSVQEQSGPIEGPKARQEQSTTTQEPTAPQQQSTPAQEPSTPQGKSTSAPESLTPQEQLTQAQNQSPPNQEKSESTQKQL